MKVSPEARRLAKYKEKKKEFSVATLQFDVTFCTPIPCAPSIRERYLEALLRNHTTYELLFGKNTSTDEENEALFLKVKDYILKAKRFVH